MSNPPIPSEILDHIVDNLRDESKALQNSCLVTKSWVPRARKHLFTDISLSLPETFLDPSNSPAYHTHALSVRCVRVVTVADAREGDWIQTFCRVVRLDVDSTMHGSEFSSALFRGCSRISPRCFWHTFTLTDFRSRSFPTSSRRPVIGRSLDPQQ